MGKVAIVQSSQLAGCWSACRYTGACHTCKRVQECKLPESKAGRLVLAAAALAYWKEKARTEIERAQAVVDRLEKEVKSGR